MLLLRGLGKHLAPVVMVVHYHVLIAHRSAYGVLIIIMGNSHSRRRNSTGLPKQPVRKPSDSDAKVKVVDGLGRVQTPVDIKDGESAQEPMPYPVSNYSCIV